VHGAQEKFSAGGGGGGVETCCNWGEKDKTEKIMETEKWSNLKGNKANRLEQRVRFRGNNSSQKKKQIEGARLRLGGSLKIDNRGQPEEKGGDAVLKGRIQEPKNEGPTVKNC